MSRDVFENNLIAKLGDEGYRKVRGAKVGIAGAGGLGSNCATALARSGFRSFVIADFDTVDAANLDRQAYFSDQIGMKKPNALKANLLRIMPGIDIEALALRLDRANIVAVFAGCDVIVECFDKIEAKSIFVEALLPSGKFLVAVSGLGGIGESDGIRVHRIKENLVMVGDLRSDIETAPALAPRIMIAAAKQADVVLEHVLNSGS